MQFFLQCLRVCETLHNVQVRQPLISQKYFLATVFCQVLLKNLFLSKQSKSVWPPANNNMLSWCCRTWIQMQQTRHWSRHLQLLMLTCTSSSRQPVEEAAQPHRCPSSCATHLPGSTLPWPPQESASWRSGSSGNRQWSCCNSC